MKFLFIFLLTITEDYVEAIELNDTEYNRMPPIYQLDNYEGCLQRDGDVYCTTHFSLVSDIPSVLLDVIHEYSKDTATRFNHSKLRYGLCLVESCGDYYKRRETVSVELLESCLNRTFSDKYDLQTRVNEFSCIEYNETVENDFGDFCMGLVIFSLLGITIFATFLDKLPNTNIEDHAILLNFSLTHNWGLLTAAGESYTDGKRNIFKSLHGVRVLLISLVILGHSGVPHVTTMENTKLLEESYKDVFAHVFFNGNVIVQAYFVISGMLLMYKLLMYNEESINCKLLPKAIAARWLRLVPSHGFVLLFTSTWLRYTKSGPLWETALGDEIRDCQSRGWWGLLYLNNFLDNVQCLPHTWYLAADMQLYCFGLLLYVLAKNNNIINYILTLSFLLGTLIVAVITYILDLDAIIIVSLPNIRTCFGTDPTYNEVYRKSYTNVSSYVIGLSLGYLIYNLQRSNFKIEKFKKYRYLYWATIPACFIPILLAKIFYHGPPRDSIYIRLLFAIFAKPFFAVLVAILIFGFAFKYEKMYRGLLEWPGWLAPSRLSYCAYLVHFLIVELYTARHNQLTHITSYTNVVMVTGFIISSFAVALPLWLLVEAPFTGLIHYMANRSTYLQESLKSKKS